MKRRLWILLGVMAAFVPLGLISDAPAWGEWGREYYQKILGFIPHGIASAPERGVLPDYAAPGLGNIPGYYLSAVVGIAAVVAVYYLLYRMVKRG
jgi:uncharacterized membrane protein